MIRMELMVTWEFANFTRSYEFQVAKGKYKQFTIVKKLIRETDTVINACDVDREGSNIFYSIYNQTGARGSDD